MDLQIRNWVVDRKFRATQSVYLVIGLPASRPVMIQKNARLLQGKNFCEARDTVEHELATAGGNRGGADAPHQRRPPQLRHRPKRGELAACLSASLHQNKSSAPAYLASARRRRLAVLLLRITRGARRSRLLVQIHSIQIIPTLGQNIDSGATKNAVSVNI